LEEGGEDGKGGDLELRRKGKRDGKKGEGARCITTFIWEERREEGKKKKKGKGGERESSKELLQRVSTGDLRKRKKKGGQEGLV